MPGSRLPNKTDIVIIGAGAAGLMCAIRAGQRDRSVVLLDHANKVGKKILMSGGGRCNFTNIHTSPDNFVSQNPHFCKSALSRFTPADFIALVDKHAIAYHEKKLGQLFCDDKAGDILNMLVEEAEQAGVLIRSHCHIESVKSVPAGFDVRSSHGTVECKSLVVASGGLSIPKMGATAFGYELAKQFDINIVAPRAGLVPLTLDKVLLDKLSQLSGSSLEVEVLCNNMTFKENLLFTHRGLSGPALLQISSYWKPGDEIVINLLPNLDLFALLQEKQQTRPKAELKTILAETMSKNMAQVLIQLWFANEGFVAKPLNQIDKSALAAVAKQFHQWKVKPSGTEGYRTAEVTLGGVNTDELSSKTMEAKKQAGLYFIGEVVDVSGHLGGFNFQWAWASAAAAAEYI